MQRRPSMFIRFGVAAALVLSVPSTPSQQPTPQPAQPTAQQILTQLAQHNAERQAMLSGYTAIRTYRIDYTGVGGPRSAELIVRAEYHAPGEKTFTILSESGSPMISTRVLRKFVESEREASNRSSQLQSTLSPGNYNATLVGRERLHNPSSTADPNSTPDRDSAEDIDTWVLDVTPKLPGKFNYRGRVWISVDDLAVVRIQGSPARNPSFWLTATTLDSRFRRAGGFWLPASNTTISHIRIGGEARLSINYGDYSIETKPELAQTSAAPTLP